MLGTYRRLNYHQFPLALKLSLPFICTFVGLWIIGAVLLGQYFANKLEQQQQQTVADLAGLLERELSFKQRDLQQSARFLAGNRTIIRAISQQNNVGLNQTVLPLRAILHADQVTIITSEQQVLL